MRIAMIGTGYVGLVSGACFAKFGVEVTCVDKDESKIERLRRGEMPIYEPGLDALVASGFENGRMTVTTELAMLISAMSMQPPGKSPNPWRAIRLSSQNQRFRSGPGRKLTG
jgi:UDP-glucose 6-dehydrogenase